MDKSMKGLPRAADPETAQWIYNRIQQLSQPCGTELVRNGDLIEVVL